MIGVIIQPSYIPWRGFFDLIKQADVFVFYDDVQYDKHGWRNRNRILTQRGSEWLTIPVKSKGNLANRLPINETEIAWHKPWNRQHCDKLIASYSRTPYFDRYFPAIAERLMEHKSLLVDYTVPLTCDIASWLGIVDTRFVFSSKIGIRHDDPTERLILNLQSLGVTTYISGPTARVYLEPERFNAAGIKLEFMVYDYPAYDQGDGVFDPAVSIVDLLFRYGPDAPSYIWPEAIKTSRATS